MKLKWQGINQNGKKFSGIQYAASELELKNNLLEQGIALTKLKKVKITGSFIQEQIYLFSSLSVLLDSGLSLVDSLMLCREKPALKRIDDALHTVIQHVQGGYAFWESMQVCDSIFPEFACQVVRVGESTGQLSIVCNQISNYLSMKNSFTRKVKKALLPTLITFIVSLVLIFLVFVLIVPRFHQMLDSVDKPLPTITAPC